MDFVFYDKGFVLHLEIVKPVADARWTMIYILYSGDGTKGMLTSLTEKPGRGLFLE